MPLYSIDQPGGSTTLTDTLPGGALPNGYKTYSSPSYPSQRVSPRQQFQQQLVKALGMDKYSSGPERFEQEAMEAAVKKYSQLPGGRSLQMDTRDPRTAAKAFQFMQQDVGRHLNTVKQERAQAEKMYKDGMKEFDDREKEQRKIEAERRKEQDKIETEQRREAMKEKAAEEKERKTKYEMTPKVESELRDKAHSIAKSRVADIEKNFTKSKQLADDEGKPIYLDAKGNYIYIDGKAVPKEKYNSMRPMQGAEEWAVTTDPKTGKQRFMSQTEQDTIKRDLYNKEYSVALKALTEPYTRAMKEAGEQKGKESSAIPRQQQGQDMSAIPTGKYSTEDLYKMYDMANQKSEKDREEVGKALSESRYREGTLYEEDERGNKAPYGTSRRMAKENIGRSGSVAEDAINNSPWLQKMEVENKLQDMKDKERDALAKAQEEEYQRDYGAIPRDYNILRNPPYKRDWRIRTDKKGRQHMIPDSAGVLDVNKYSPREIVPQEKEPGILSRMVGYPSYTGGSSRERWYDNSREPNMRPPDLSWLTDDGEYGLQSEIDLASSPYYD